MHSVFQPINEDHRKLSDVVYQSLLEAILAQKVSSGSRLYEEEIARQLNVSRTPVREALNQLEREGLVRRIPHKGAEVTRLTERDREEIFALMEVVAGLASRFCARRIGEEALDELEELNERAENCVQNGDGTRFEQVNREFHRKVIQACGSKRIIRIYNMFEHQAASLCGHGGGEKNSLRRSLAQHKQLTEALKNGEGERAEDLMRRHINRILDRDEGRELWI